MSARLTQARVAQLAIEIKQVARSARGIDPLTKGHISYPAMCGGLQAVIRGIVLDTAGPAAAALVQEAFAAACDNESPDALAAIAKAKGST